MANALAMADRAQSVNIFYRFKNTGTANFNKDMKKKRVIAIDILKFFAVIVVLNSHMDICWGEYSYLGTGGAIGDALFFFCSGFMLFKGPSIRFDNFMKRRISRIYPTVFVVAIVGALIFGQKTDIWSIIVSGGGWFVSCIMIYYIVLWFVKRYMMSMMPVVWAAVALLILAWFYLWFDYNGPILIYGNTYFKWALFFMFMLQGAIIGLEDDRYTYSRWDVLKLIICVGLWYGIMYLAKYPIMRMFQYLSALPLLGVTYYAYKCCCAPLWKKLYNHPYIGSAIFIIGGLCLECYLIQGFFITDKYNHLFPLNIPIIVVFILLMSYAVNFLSNGFAQTFRKEEYNWKQCFLKKPKDVCP